ncbi:hypothetical protein [Rhizobium phage RHph_X3_2]|nr:hypothetical protein [Rhizobium phage RHph_X3_2]
MSNVAASYSSKSTAIRGAKRAGMENPVAYQGADGRWYVSDAGEVLGPADDFEASEAELAAQQGRPSHDEEETGANNVEEADLFKGTDAASDEAAEEAAAKVAATKEKAPRAPSYKQLPRLPKSEVEKPLEVIFAFLDANPDMKRKAAVSALVAKGINFYTARTQYQKWYTKRKEAK